MLGGSPILLFSLPGGGEGSGAYPESTRRFASRGVMQARLHLVKVFWLLLGKWVEEARVEAGCLPWERAQGHRARLRQIPSLSSTAAIRQHWFRGTQRKATHTKEAKWRHQGRRGTPGGSVYPKANDSQISQWPQKIPRAIIKLCN